MVSKRAQILAVIGLGLACLASMATSTPAIAQSETTGTVIIHSSSIGLGIGVSWGDGVVEWRGKKYVFTLRGLSVADLGVARVTARGNVRNLRRIEDFEGNYVAGTAGGAVGGGAAVSALRNQNGVEIELQATARGVRLTLAGAGVEIRLK